MSNLTTGSKITIKVTVNNRVYEREINSDMLLLHFIREELGLTGTKEGCGAGECGACTVILNGNAVNSCLILAAEVNGAEIKTIEGEITADGDLSDLQQSFNRHHAVQCGFCTPGMIMSSRALLNKNPHPNPEEIQTALEGNFCRCTGYKQILEAVEDVAETKPGQERKQEQERGGLKYV